MRYLWLTLGFLCVGLGFVGIIVPGLPATGFFVAAAWCFSRSSEKFLSWLLHLPLVGPLLCDYRAGLGMPLKTKWLASVSLSLAVSISAIFAIRMPWAKASCITLGLIGLWFIWTRVPLREKVLAERKHSDSNQA
ncbi:YbaN family protein [Armatimonas sp.]|uniref:YbaN family protein n=1 Tax=Armatimonas sp. TaxID=1872638 RepID=UPI003752EFF8